MWLLRKVGIQKISLRVMLIEFAELAANIEFFSEYRNTASFS